MSTLELGTDSRHDVDDKRIQVLSTRNTSSKSLTGLIVRKIVQPNGQCFIERIFKNKSNFDDEVDILTKLNPSDHFPSIVSTLTSFDKEDNSFNYHIVTNFIPGVDLYDFLYEENFGKHIKMKWLKCIYLKICKVVYILHSHEIVHHDIKFENLIINVTNGREFLYEGSHDGPVEFSIHLIDFEFAEYLPNSLGSNSESGTVMYFAPEKMKLSLFHPSSLENWEKVYCGYKVDIWALGLILYFIFENGKVPFNLDDIKKFCYIFPLDFNSKFNGKNETFHFQNLVTKTLNLQPTHRPCISEIITNKFFSYLYFILNKNHLPSLTMQMKWAY